MDIRNIRISLLLAVAALSATVGVGVTYGVNANRLDNAERAVSDQRKLIEEHDKALIRIEIQYREIVWRLRRIEKAVTEDDEDAKVSPR